MSNIKSDVNQMHVITREETGWIGLTRLVFNRRRTDRECVYLYTVLYPAFWSCDL